MFSIFIFIFIAIAGFNTYKNIQYKFKNIQHFRLLVSVHNQLMIDCIVGSWDAILKISAREWLDIAPTDQNLSNFDVVLRR